MSTPSASQRVTIWVDGESVAAAEGQLLGAVLHAAMGGFRATADGTRRGVFCGMGVCFECLVAVNGKPGIRACVTPVRDGMRVTTTRSAVAT